MKFKLLSFMLFFLAALTPAVAQTEALAVDIEKMTDQPLPVSVSSGKLQNFQFTSQLSAQLSSYAGAEVSSVDLLILLYRDSKVFAGEGWTETAPGGIISRETKLALKPGDHAILIVKSVNAKGRTWKLNSQDVHERVREQIEGRSSLALPVEISMNERPRFLRVQATGAFCSGALADAKGACGDSGIASFSCDAAKTSFSFTCKTGGTPSKPAQPPAGNQ